jgi:hypothetical protein
MPRGAAAGRKKGAEDVWAQCDNAACKKWRRLLPGTKVDETRSWWVLQPGFNCVATASAWHAMLMARLKANLPTIVVCTLL